MSDARGQQTERGEFLVLQHLLFELHALGNVVQEDQATQARAGLAHQRSDGSVDDEGAAGALLQFQFVNSGNALVGCAGGQLCDQVRREHTG